MNRIYISGIGTYTSAGYGFSDTCDNIRQGKSTIPLKKDWSLPEIGEQYFGTDGRPVLSTDGYASVSSEYDPASGLVARRTWYDTDGKAVCANGYYAFSLPDGRECDVYLRRRRHDKEVEAIMKQYQRDLNKPMPRYKEFFLRTAVVIEIEGCENVKEVKMYCDKIDEMIAKKRELF